jgi:hemoglobin
MRKTLFAVTIAALLAFGALNLAPAHASGMATPDKKTKAEKSDKDKSKKSDKKSDKQKSLYSRLGGKKAITAVVDEFVNNVAADDRINKFFADTAKDPKRLAAFKGKLVDQICQASGGPCKYKGKDMKTAHAGMGVSEADFNALVEDLVKALDKFNVGQPEKDELLGALGPMKGDIVEKM